MKKGKSRAVSTPDPDPAPIHTYQDLQYVEEDPPRFTVGQMATQVLALAYHSEEGTSFPNFVDHYADMVIHRHPY